MVSPGTAIRFFISDKLSTFSDLISIDFIVKCFRSFICVNDLTIILKFSFSFEIFLYKFKNKEFPSLRIFLLLSKRSEKINSSKTPPKSVNFIIA